ncbi:cupredoxin domain-containing protein [Nocardioides ultimimeridianus]
MSHPSPARTPAARTRAAVLVATVLTALLGALALGASPAHAAQHTITIKQYAFQPGSMSIRQGDTITWTNQDSVGHDVEVTNGPASFHSPMLSQGQSWSFTFSAPGTYSYICSVHPDMRATVTVAAAPAPPAAQPAAQPPAQHQSAAGTTTTTHSGRSAPRHAARGGTKPAKQPAAAPTAAPAPSVVTPGTDAALDPLLLVAGLAVAVVVFCLLLLTSRPERPLLAPADPAPAPGGDHRADAADHDTAVDLPAVDKVPVS